MSEKKSENIVLFFSVCPRTFVHKSVEKRLSLMVRAN